jgi:hypothetical protein
MIEEQLKMKYVSKNMTMKSTLNKKMEDEMKNLEDLEVLEYKIKEKIITNLSRELHLR